MHTNFKVVKGKVFKNVEKGKKVVSTYIGDDFNIAGYKINMDTGEIIVKFQTFSILSCKPMEFELDRAKMTSKDLKEKLKLAMRCVLNANAMYEFFQEKETSLMYHQSLLEKENSYSTIYDIFKIKYNKENDDRYNVTESCADREFVHSHIGWKRLNEKFIFQGDVSYGGDNHSTYIGEKDIQKKGDFREVKKLYDSIISKNPNLQLAAAMGVCATVLGYVNNRWNLTIPNPVFSIAGATSTGKTTGLELAISQCGCPDGRKKGSMFQDFQGTENAVIKDIGANTGFPIAVDDTKLADEGLKRSMLKLLYALANGTDKKRVGAYGHEIRERDVFETAILISGENSIFSFVKEVGGLAVRVLEFQDVKWTNNAEESEKIKAVVRKNYGHITPIVAQYLLDIIDTEEEALLHKNFDNWYKKCINYAKRQHCFTKITERVSYILALLMVSLEVLEKVMEVKFNSKAVFIILCENIIEKLFLESEEDSIAERGYALLREFYMENKEFFDREWGGSFGGGSSSNYKGKIIQKSKKTTFKISDTEITTSICLGITNIQAEKILVKDGKFKSVSSVMTALHKRGALSTKSSKKNFRNDANKFVIGDEVVIGGYQIYMPEEVYEDYNDIDGSTGEAKVKGLYE